MVQYLGSAPSYPEVARRVNLTRLMRTSAPTRCLRTAAIAALLAASPVTAYAQRLGVGDLWEDYARTMSLLGKAAPHSWVIRPLSLEQGLAGLRDSANPWREQVPRQGSLLRAGGLRATAEPVSLRFFDNSAYPSGQNDGAIWEGRGPTAALEAGVTARWGPLTITLRPELIYIRNLAFPLAQVTDSSRTPYANAWWARGLSAEYIDLPQRFGPDPLWWLDPGQTSVRLDWRGLAAGVSTENLWWGPGIANAIIMSDNAAGFPHAFAGTGRPVAIGVGTVEGQWVFGRLTQSKWSQRRPDGIVRYLTGLVAAYEPSFLPGLTLGAIRAYYFNSPPGGPSFRDYTLVFQGLLKKGLASSSNPTGDDVMDQLASFFARWAVPGGGFEAYVEWARNDHSWDFRDFVLAPEHSQGYTVGFQKAIGLRRGSVVRLGGELTHLERSNDISYRASEPFYVHFVVRDGYTQRGQVVGAGIGPGGDAQVLGADLFAAWGSVGGYVRRQVHDNDAHYNLFRFDGGDFWRYDVSLGWGLRGTLLLRSVLGKSFDPGPLELQWLLEAMLERNRYYVYLNDVRNTHLELSLRWWPSVGGGIAR